ncbi:hypothetical protein [Nitrosomonas aestuarii]|uniref:hypothetical protein n=1 Tax=Nitrosomonas aestuarii TaxID=52441 RepID=UPI000B806583|nr:hypothetical protein [Nitrosomonas aestuarii]
MLWLKDPVDLILGKYLGLDQTEINQLALLGVTFFQIMPTDVTHAHTLHEVMTVANRLFMFPINHSNCYRYP